MMITEQIVMLRETIQFENKLRTRWRALPMSPMELLEGSAGRDRQVRDSFQGVIDYAHWKNG